MRVNYGSITNVTLTDLSPFLIILYFFTPTLLPELQYCTLAKFSFFCFSVPPFYLSPNIEWKEIYSAM